MTGKMQLVMTTVEKLSVGDLLVLPKALVTEPVSVEVMALADEPSTTLLPTPSTRRVSVWVRSTHTDRTFDRAWLYGTFAPDALALRMEFA